MDENVRPDVFDRFMCLPGLRLLEPFYRRNKDILLYLFFGFLAFLVSIGSYATLTMVFDLNELVANVISWILAVFFAFFTNRVWVFHAPSGTCGAFARQLLSFFAGRAATLVVEEGIILAFITILDFPGMAVKVAGQIVVIILNYFISKYLVFLKKGTKREHNWFCRKRPQ